MVSRSRASALACVLVGGLLAACGMQEPDGSALSTTPPAAPGPVVLTTVFPVTALTQAVAGPCATVETLLPPGADPHDHQARPADRVRLQQARLVVVNGLGFESFLDGVMPEEEGTDLTVVEMSAGLEPIAAAPAQPGDASPADDHDHDQGQGHGDGHGHGGVNPHGWLDPRQAVQQVATIRDALVAHDPGCATGYRQRAAAYSEKLLALDRRLEQALAPHRGRLLVTQHDVAPYLARRYGLRSTFLVAEPHTPPSPGDLRRLDTELRQAGIRAILIDPGEAPGALKALASDRGLALVPFDPLEVAVVPVERGPAHFLQMMERNGEALQQALGKPPSADR